MVSLLLDCHELAARLATNDPPIVLDVRWTLGGPPGMTDFRRGHIPGAHFVDLDRELSAPPGPGRHPVPDAASFAEAMRRHGVRRSRLVVAYDAATSTSAARAWWLLRYFGHPNVALLDGGFAAWMAAGLPVEEGDDRDPAAGDFEAEPGGMPLLDAAGAASDCACRGARRRSGSRAISRRDRARRRRGRPYSRRAEYSSAANREPGRHLPLAGRAARALRRGGDPARPGRGRLLRLRSGGHRGSLRAGLAGIDAALYAGSWSEWITDPNRPIEVGA